MSGSPLLVLWVAAAVATTAPDDFARGRVVHTVDGQLVQRITVPPDVYEWVTSADLGDLRVFNGDQREVPYRVRQPRTQQEYTAWRDLPVFALPSHSVDARKGASVNVEVDEHGAVVAVTGAHPDSVRPASFLLDASSVDVPVDELSVDWQAGVEGFVGAFRVDASADLNQWRTVVASTTLAALATQDRTVRVDRIPLPGATAPYYRITQLDGGNRIVISSVRARARLAQAPDRHWKSLSGREVEGGYEYAIDGAFPVDRVRVDLDQQFYLLVADLYAKAQPGHSWRALGRHRFYRVAGGDVVAESEPVVAATSGRYWRLELIDGAGQTPRLRVGWMPDEVLFLTQGPGPYLLAYGQAGRSGRQWPLADLLAGLGDQTDLDALAPATLGATTTLGGPDRLIPGSQPVNWGTALLWTVLIAGVAVVGYFAQRLIRASSAGG